MRDLLFGAIVLLALILLIIDVWPALAGTPVEDSVLCDGGEGQGQE